jgi:hypothetical protein
MFSSMPTSMSSILHQINKHKILAIIAMLLFIVASVKSSAMHNTVLGKTILVGLVILLTMTNKIAGLIAVVVLVIMYQSQSNMFYYSSPYNLSEGFTVTDASGNTKTVSVSTPPSGSSGMGQPQSGQMKMPKEIQFDISGNLELMGTPPPPPPSTTSASTTSGQEGFDLLGTEDTLRKGKQSNTISVKKNTNQTDNLIPFEPSKYVENFLILG